MSISRQNLTVVIVTFKSENVIHDCIRSISEDIKIVSIFFDKRAASIVELIKGLPDKFTKFFSLMPFEPDLAGIKPTNFI